MTARRLHSYLLLLLVTLIWGAAAPIIKFTLEGIEPFPFLSYRFTISFVIALVALALTKYKLPRTKDAWAMLFLSGFLAIPAGLAFLFIGLKDSTVLDMSLIVLIGPLLISAGGVWFLHDRMTHKEKLGTAIAVLGSALVIFAPILLNGHAGLKLSGNLFLLLHITSDVIAVLLLKKLIRKNISPGFITHISFVLGFIVIIPYTLTLYSPAQLINSVAGLSLAHHAGVWYMAIMSGTIAYTIRSIAQKSIEVSEASLFGYLSPLISTPIAILWLGEQITLPFIIGGVIIASGVFIAEYRSN